MLDENGNSVCDWSLWQEHEVVPLFGDVVIGPFNYVQKTMNYDPQHWPRCLNATASQQATILTNMSEYRHQHSELICELLLLSGQRQKLVQVFSRNLNTCVTFISFEFRSYKTRWCVKLTGPNICWLVVLFNVLFFDLYNLCTPSGHGDETLLMSG